MKNKYAPILLCFPPLIHLALMLLFSCIPPEDHTYFTLALIALAVSAPLTLLLLAMTAKRAPAILPLFPLSFASVSLILKPVMLIILKLRPYDQLPYEWSKYPRIIGEYYVIPFVVLGLLLWLLSRIHQRTASDRQVDSSSRSVRCTLLLNRCMIGLVAILVLAMPALVRWYNTVRILSDAENIALIAAFYCCVPVVLYALWSLDRLLVNIRNGLVFEWANVHLIRRVCWCCAVVSLLCIPAAVFYAPLIFLSVIMFFLCPVVHVVCQVFRAAIELREENDLTI